MKRSQLQQIIKEEIAFVKEDYLDSVKIKVLKDRLIKAIDQKIAGKGGQQVEPTFPMIVDRVLALLNSYEKDYLKAKAEGAEWPIDKTKLSIS